jgi:hypothetical protein
MAHTSHLRATYEPHTSRIRANMATISPHTSDSYSEMDSGTLHFLHFAHIVQQQLESTGDSGGEPGLLKWFRIVTIKLHVSQTVDT